MVATLSKNASGTSWSIGNQRSYDVWGGVRSGSATGGPKQRYCANLRHVHDDESRLIYMRARYYEPSSGRFISEDPARYGHNWHTYCGNDPINFADPNEEERQWIQIGDFEVSFDWYTRSGTGEVMGDIHWRKVGDRNLVNGRGSWTSDG